jgi:general secretion pathway protein A
MYEQFFDLNSSPFQLSPDPSFLFTSRKIKEALTSISDAVRQRKGFVVMTGEAGTGKTLVLQCLLELWQREQFRFAYFVGFRLSAIDFLRYVIGELGIDVIESTKGNLLRALYGFFREQFEKGLTTVLIIDEAHQLPRSVLEQIAVLTNVETAQQKLVQIVLAGQPELDEKLDSVELRSLKQRIAVRCHLEPIRQTEIRDYIQTRLQLAGANPLLIEIFPEETIRAIYQHSQGIPRLVNSICDQAMMSAYAHQLRSVSVEIISGIACEFRLGGATESKHIEEVFSTVTPVENVIGHNSAETTSCPKVPILENPPAESRLNLVSTVRVAPLEMQGSTKQVLKTTEALVPGTLLGEASKKSENQVVERSSSPTVSRMIFRSPPFIIVVIAVGLGISAEGLLMAHRNKLGSLLATHNSRSARQSILQPAQQTTSITEFDVQSVSAGTPAIDGPTRGSSPHAEHSVLLSEIARTVAKPILKSAPAPYSVEPPRIGNERKDLNLDDLYRTAPPSLGQPLITPPPNISGAVLKPNVSAPVRFGGKIREPRLLAQILPEYPPVAREGRTEGDVVLQILIDTLGNITDARVISGPAILRESALDAVRGWKYEPSLLDGQPVPVQITVTVRFRL